MIKIIFKLLLVGKLSNSMHSLLKIQRRFLLLGMCATEDSALKKKRPPSFWIWKESGSLDLNRRPPPLVRVSKKYGVLEKYENDDEG